MTMKYRKKNNGIDLKPTQLFFDEMVKRNEKGKKIYLAKYYAGEGWQLEEFQDVTSLISYIQANPDTLGSEFKIMQELGLGIKEDNF